MKASKIQHPFKWYVPVGAKALIIGTFPPVESRWAFHFFYPNPRNLFWQLMAAIAGVKLSGNPATAVEERRGMLDKLGVGVTDMGGVIRRLANNSLDENLELIEHMPVFEILDENPGIRRILLTSSSGKVSALAWFRLYLVKHGITHVVPKGPKPLMFEIVYRERPIEVFVMFSPSPRAANRISFENMVETYRSVINRES